MTTLDWLQPEGANNGDVVYRLDEAREKYEVHELTCNGWLVINRDDHKIWMRFAVLEFYMSNGNGKNVVASCVFHGEGATGNLRECRHTWWGDDGYVFYPNGNLIAAAFRALSEFFDDMAS
jgi:hypothetical protein